MMEMTIRKIYKYVGTFQLQQMEDEDRLCVTMFPFETNPRLEISNFFLAS